MPKTDTPKTELTYLDKRMFCQLRDSNVTLALGLVGATSVGARNPPELVQFQSGTATITASLIKVTPRLVLFRQVMSEGAGKTFHEAQQ